MKCPKCESIIVLKKYKEIPIYACTNENCKAAFTVDEIERSEAFALALLEE